MGFPRTSRTTHRIRPQIYHPVGPLTQPGPTSYPRPRSGPHTRRRSHLQKEERQCIKHKPRSQGQSLPPSTSRFPRLFDEAPMPSEEQSLDPQHTAATKTQEPYSWPSAPHMAFHHRPNTMPTKRYLPRHGTWLSQSSPILIASKTAMLLPSLPRLHTPWNK